MLYIEPFSYRCSDIFFNVKQWTLKTKYWIHEYLRDFVLLSFLVIGWISKSVVFVILRYQMLKILSCVFLILVSQTIWIYGELKKNWIPRFTLLRLGITRIIKTSKCWSNSIWNIPALARNIYTWPHYN